MNTSLDDDTLQRFYDGELSPLERQRVQARIEADPALRRRLAELARLTELLRQGTEQLGSTLDADALFASIEAGIAKPAAADAGGRLRVIAGEWLTHRRRAVLSMSGALAVAAATLLVLLRPGSGAPVNEAGAPATTGPLAASAPASDAHGASVIHGSSVEEVDFGASTGTVFELDNEGVAVAVVWISDDEGP